LPLGQSKDDAGKGADRKGRGRSGQQTTILQRLNLQRGPADRLFLLKTRA
jgi:hypothetical protein